MTLAPVCTRITLKHTRCMLYESLNYRLNFILMHFGAAECIFGAKMAFTNFTKFGIFSPHLRPFPCGLTGLKTIGFTFKTSNLRLKMCLLREKSARSIWMLKLEAGGKPSTWFPPGGLVEHTVSLESTTNWSRTCRSMQWKNNLHLNSYLHLNERRRCGNCNLLIQI